MLLQLAKLLGLRLTQDCGRLYVHATSLSKGLGGRDILATFSSSIFYPLLLLPTLEIGLDKLKNLESDYTYDQKVLELKRVRTVYICINLGTNPIYETLSERLEHILKSRREEKRGRELADLYSKLEYSIIPRL